MTEEEMKEHAARLIGYHNEEYEFCLVYEDETICDELEESGLSRTEQQDYMRRILGYMYDAQLTIEIDGEVYE